MPASYTIHRPMLRVDPDPPEPTGPLGVQANPEVLRPHRPPPPGNRW